MGQRVHISTNCYVVQRNWLRGLCVEFAFDNLQRFWNGQNQTSQVQHGEAPNYPYYFDCSYSVQPGKYDIGWPPEYSMAPEACHLLRHCPAQLFTDSSVSIVSGCFHRSESCFEGGKRWPIQSQPCGDTFRQSLVSLLWSRIRHRTGSESTFVSWLYEFTSYLELFVLASVH